MSVQNPQPGPYASTRLSSDRIKALADLEMSIDAGLWLVFARYPGDDKIRIDHVNRCHAEIERLRRFDERAQEEFELSA